MRNRFQQPEDYQPAPIDRQERVEEHFRNKRQDDIYEAEQDEDRAEADPYEQFQ